MGERANFQNNYLMRYAIMAAICWFLAAWFAYDAVIGYPAKIPAALAYDELREIENADKRFEQWQAVAKERGWTLAGEAIDPPEDTAEEVRNSIIGQYVYMGLCLLAGIPALVFLVRSKGRWVESTEKGLTTSWGQAFEFTDVSRLNKKRWEQKGIARAVYKDGTRTRIFVFDDFKYEREPLGKILRRLEAALDREQIVGGPTEEEIDARKAAALEAQAEQLSANEDEATEGVANPGDETHRGEA